MKYQSKVLGIFVALLFMSNSVWAKPKLEMKVTSEKEIVQVVNGVETIKRVAAETIAPGNVLYFVLQYSNNGDEVATNVVINNPVPMGTEYIQGTATGANNNISYSADNGKTFNVPKQLTYVVTASNGKALRKQIPAAKYSHVKWVLATIPPGSSGKLEFKVQVK